MIVLSSYPMMPRACAYCNGTDTPCIDTMRDDDGDGPTGRVAHVYLCWKCLLHAARTVLPKVGYSVATSGELVALNLHINELVERVADANAERDRALAARDALVASYGPLPDPQPEVEVEALGERIETDADLVLTGAPARKGRK